MSREIREDTLSTRTHGSDQIYYTDRPELKLFASLAFQEAPIFTTAVSNSTPPAVYFGDQTNCTWDIPLFNLLVGEWRQLKVYW